LQESQTWWRNPKTAQTGGLPWLVCYIIPHPRTGRRVMSERMNNLTVTLAQDLHRGQAELCKSFEQSACSVVGVSLKRNTTKGSCKIIPAMPSTFHICLAVLQLLYGSDACCRLRTDSMCALQTGQTCGAGASTIDWILRRKQVRCSPITSSKHQVPNATDERLYCAQASSPESGLGFGLEVGHGYAVDLGGHDEIIIAETACR
jgi:hypothetical protein